ncbi:uncharacterized protein LOC126340742 isoform X2 [Schistocerca gregaria]|nr:uncharacterized protein LOC126340742 isoform X2 [Schistocerca gregaria]XP_049857673.1 uncharacterized protein LOC126340742 isoform X2 [Schistocerca gregaria]XP_049857674.1 uncharacterized protein LOC126340742 isoform X2 [Schistocerca gregaria]XP_049857676.1 uncharacterized protein LOC126340742 isoform X2 [Schistocerca gregaria]
MDLNMLPSTTHAHDFHSGLSRVVMVRKTEQRTFASTRSGEEPKFETVTRETVETFMGHRPQKVITSEKRDVIKGMPQDLLASLPGTPSQNGTSKFRSPSVSPDIPSPKKAETQLSLLKSRLKPVSPTTNGAASTESMESDADFATDCLNAHNEYREKHGVPPLRLSKKLCKYSEEWAKHLAQKGHSEHRQNSDYGENIFCSWSSSGAHKVTGREPVDHWYSEIKDHPFGREPRDLKSGHFSQVVWRDSEELGVAVARSRSGQVFVVANYSPPGNFLGSFAENVPPLGGFPKDKAKKTPVKYGAVVNGSAVNGSASDEDFAEEGLRIHNEYRRKHGVPDLKLSKELCEYATEWAKTLAKEDKFCHRPDGKYGENIFCVWSSDAGKNVTARDACLKWYKEVKDFTFGVEPRMLKSGHFSQMIWRSSKELGMGIARSKNGRAIIVANYNPRGNYIGQFVSNVPKPL